MMKYQAVFLDLDGTLVDSIPDIAQAANGMLVDLGRDKLPLSTLMTFVGKGSDVLIKRALSANIDFTEPESALFEQAKLLFKKHYHLVNGQQSILYPNVKQGLTRMRDMGLKLAVVTNKPQEFTLPLLEHTGLTAFFDLVVSGDTCLRKKPHPDQLLFACEHFKISPENALFIGDSQNDTQAANAANMDVLALPYGYNEGISVQTLTVNAIVEDMVVAADWIAATLHT